MSLVPLTQKPLRVLLVEDSPGDALLIERAFRNAMLYGVEMDKSTTLAGGLRLLSKQQYDVALLDRSLPDVEGFSGLFHLQTMAPYLPVVFLTAYQDERTAFEAIEQGAQDYLFKDKIDGHVIRRAVQYAILRKQFEGVLITRANFDALTGLANRILFESRMDMALARIRRKGGNLTLLFMDVNDFKGINDTYGHIAGDTLLKHIGQQLRKVLRPYDTAARFGGDEFAVLLEDLPSLSHAEIVARKIVDEIDQPCMLGGTPVRVGVSVGIASCNGNRQPATRDSLLSEADQAMYAAKSQHGGKIAFAVPPGGPDGMAS